MKITFARKLDAQLKGSHTLLVIGPTAALKKKWLPKVLGKGNANLLAELAKDAKAGDLGAVASTLTRGKVRRLVLGVLPDKVSRHNAPSRSLSVGRVVSAANLGDRGKVAILLLLDDPSHYLAVANAVGRALPEFSAKSKRSSSLRVQLLALDAEGKPIEVDAVVGETMDATRQAAALVDTPPTDLNPKAFGDRAKEILAAIPNVKVEQIVGKKLIDAGLNGIHAVGRCAAVEPRLLIARYTPGNPKSGKHVALVGKGVTYDTGGLNLKTGGFMSNMKCDMGGAAAVLGAFRVLAQTGCEHRVTALLCLAENAIGPQSYKPDDIYTAHSGKTVEINNTDAEGRLLLADGVSYAAREIGASVILDAATLTGAALVATGSIHAAIISNDEALEATVIAAGRRSGDLAHGLLFAPEIFKQEFKSEVADMRNSVKNRLSAQTSCAAQFVYWHIMDRRNIRWCHVDLAGPAFPENRGTGYGVALLSSAVSAL